MAGSGTPDAPGFPPDPLHTSLTVTGHGLTLTMAVPKLVRGAAKGAVAVSGGQSGFPQLLTAAETAAPAEAVDVVAEYLRRCFGATEVSFLIVDLTGKSVARLSTSDTAEGGREAERIPMPGSVYEEVIRTQRLYRETTGRGQRVIVPVTNRGTPSGCSNCSCRPAPATTFSTRSGKSATSWPTS